LFSTWQEHEKICGKHQISEEVIPEEQPQQDSQVGKKITVKIKANCKKTAMNFLVTCSQRNSRYEP
jgi:hypothetical protein